MKLFQWNLRFAIFNIVTYLAIGLTLGFIYEYRWGYELLTPPPLPELEVSPEARPGVNPKVCVGFLPNMATFGYTGLNCPRNYAIVANYDMGGPHKSGPGEFVPLVGNCCPLPAGDILSNRHTYDSTESCPDQYVATGSLGHCERNCTMRCTQINTKKYKLGPEQMSYQVKFASTHRVSGQGSAKRVFWETLPKGIRFSVLRSDHRKWHDDGCLGVPLGSLLTKKAGKRCDGFFYRQLQYLDGTPVKMFPDCAAISDIYHPKPECLAEADSNTEMNEFILRSRR